ncbi:MAG: potassium transporter TrkG [Desulfatiglandaceae bacterium]
MSKQASGLSYAVRFSVLRKYFGQLCLVIAALTLMPAAVSLIYGQTHITFRYAIVIAAMAGAGGFLGRMYGPREVQVNEALVLVAFMFLFTPLVMSFPMMGSGLPFSDALFEAISAATTTGLSTVTGLESMPETFLFARAWMQWYGGLGIVVFSLALLFRPGTTAKRLAVTEAREEDLVGGTKAHARRVLIVYAVLTGTGILLLLIVGVGFFDALLYTMASVSTGGFAPHDTSLAALDGPGIQSSVILVCLAGAVPLIFYYRLYKKSRRPVSDVLQLRGLLIIGGLVSLLLVFCMVSTQPFGWMQALHHAPILAFSAQTTAGFSSIELSQLPAAAKLVLIMSMAVGGGVGSTAGGFKILRLLMIISLLRVLLRRACVAMHAVVEPRIAGRRMEETEIQEALLLVLLFVAVIIFSWLPFLFMGYHPLDSLFEVVSATGTVGLSAGVVAAEMPFFLKAILCMDMLLGRLEIFAWLVMVYPRTWIGRRLS